MEKKRLFFYIIAMCIYTPCLFAKEYAGEPITYKEDTVYLVSFKVFNFKTRELLAEDYKFNPSIANEIVINDSSFSVEITVSDTITDLAKDTSFLLQLPGWESDHEEIYNPNLFSLSQVYSKIVDNKYYRTYIYTPKRDLAGAVFIFSFTYDKDKYMGYVGGGYGITVVSEDITTTSLNQNKQIKLRVYPNPSSDNLIIKGLAATSIPVSIYDLTGRQVLSVNYTNNGAIHVSHLPNGVYLLKTDSATLRFIKQ
jgi:hypothetical protein